MIQVVSPKHNQRTRTDNYCLFANSIATMNDVNNGETLALLMKLECNNSVKELKFEFSANG